eukprot:TRINITY_DN342_c0_g1_i1.p1 TRINITY_DN342_c0_g1~~TRINITY_DN342_c0_g1_i1.p1  ORF type:complete len:284 (+),score=167.52 TRINITY_DN342_c0_g1_i1:137-988(+)
MSKYIFKASGQNGKTYITEFQRDATYDSIKKFITEKFGSTPFSLHSNKNNSLISNDDQLRTALKENKNESSFHVKVGNPVPISVSASKPATTAASPARTTTAATPATTASPARTTTAATPTTAASPARTTTAATATPAATANNNKIANAPMRETAPITNSRTSQATAQAAADSSKTLAGRELAEFYIAATPSGPEKVTVAPNQKDDRFEFRLVPGKHETHVRIMLEAQKLVYFVTYSYQITEDGKSGVQTIRGPLTFQLPFEVETSNVLLDDSNPPLVTILFP